MAGRVKLGYTREFSGIPEKYPERARRYGALSHRHVRQLHQPRCAQVCAPHHVYPLQMPEGGHGGARGAPRADGGGDDAVVPTYCFEIKEVIGMRFADPERLVGKKRRNGPRRRRRCATSPAASLERTRMTTASLIDTRWAVRQLPQAEPEAGTQGSRRIARRRKKAAWM